MFQSREFDSDFGKLNPATFSQSMAAAIRGEHAEFTVPIFRVVGETLRLDGAQKVDINPDKAEIYPGTQFGAASFSVIPITEDMRFKMQLGMPLTVKDLPEPAEFGGKVVVTHSVASALAIYHATGERSVVLPAFTAENMKAVAEFAKNTLKAKDIVVVPDNTPASRRAAIDAAREVDGKVAEVNFIRDSQKTAMNLLSDAYRQAEREAPTQSPESARTFEGALEAAATESTREYLVQNVAKRYIAKSIDAAKNWTQVSLAAPGRPVFVQRQPTAEIDR